MIFYIHSGHNKTKSNKQNQKKNLKGIAFQEQDNEKAEAFVKS